MPVKNSKGIYGTNNAIGTATPKVVNGMPTRIKGAVIKPHIANHFGMVPVFINK